MNAQEVWSGDYAGQYYLHRESRDLIFKRAGFEPDADSPFVEFVWDCYPQDRACCWTIVSQALAMGADRVRCLELASKWCLNDEDGHIFADRCGFILDSFLFPGGLNSTYTIRHHDYPEDGSGLSVLDALADYWRKTRNIDQSPQPSVANAKHHTPSAEPRTPNSERS
jgi:hypothetical protein